MVLRRRIVPAAAMMASCAVLSPSSAAALALGVAATTADERNESTVDLAYDLARRTLERILLDMHHDDEDDSGDKNSSLSSEGAPEEEDEAATAEDESMKDDNLLYDGSELIEWINSNGGFIHPNVRIGLDPTGKYRGVFVKTLEEGGTAEGIKEGEVHVRVPWDLVIKPKGYDETVTWNCEGVRELYRQFILGDESKYAPYVNYLKNQPRGRIPSDWSDAGKQLLMKIVNYSGITGEELLGLPPQDDEFKSFEDIWVEGCDGEDTELARAAYFQYTSRDEDTLMVPFFDMHNHSNDPKRLNIIPEKPEEEGMPFLMRATRDIEPGEQLFISYNRCHPCWHDITYEGCDTLSLYGTPEVFSVFGFVEDFPQFWSIKSDIGERTEGGEVKYDELKFCLERPDGVGPLIVTFGDNYTPDPQEEMPIEANIQYLSGHLLRLKELESSAKSDKELMRTMTKYEWEMAWEYHERLMTTISSVILGAADLASDSSDDSGDEAEGGGNGMLASVDTEEEDGYYAVLVDDSEDSSDDAEEEEEGQEMLNKIIEDLRKRLAAAEAEEEGSGEEILNKIKEELRKRKAVAEAEATSDVVEDSKAEEENGKGEVIASDAVTDSDDSANDVGDESGRDEL